MSKKIVIDSTVHQIRTAIIDDRELIELFIEQRTHENIVGNIYRGTIKNVLPGMQAVFVDIGETKNGFLSLSKSPKKIYPGMDITVQVEKEAMGTKGAKLNDKISIAGRFLVLLPNQDYIGISQKILDVDERMRLKDIAQRLKPDNYGIIMRTNSEFKTEQEFIDEINELYKKSEKIIATAEFLKPPSLIYKNLSPIYRMVRDLFCDDIEEVVINNEDDYKSIQKAVQDFPTDFSNKIRYYNKDIELFDYYCIESQIEKALQKHVWLKSGGFLIIEQTEACVVIDVNTGKFTGKRDLQETIFRTNKEAAIEIAKQIRLRNLSGIIIVDFIDMQLIQNRNQILELLQNETKKDRNKTVVLSITELGLVQLTRKKSREPLSDILLENCNYCKGTGKIYSLQMVVQKLYHDIIHIFKQTVFNQITVYCNKELEQIFVGDNNKYLIEIETKYNKKIIFKIENSFQKNQYKIKTANI